MPSPGRPKMTSTPQSSKLSIRIPAAVLVMGTTPFLFASLLSCRAQRVRWFLVCSQTIAGILSSGGSRLRNFFQGLAESRFLPGVHGKIAQRYDTDQVLFPT